MINLHSPVVHFPIALLSVAAFFAFLSLFVKKELFKAIAFWNLVLGVLTSVAAIISGLIEENEIVHNEQVHDLLEKHKINGFAIFVVFQTLLTWFWLRRNKMGNKEYRIWVICILLGTGVVFYQGFLGGEMVFRHGTGVEPVEKQLMETRKETPLHSHDEK